MINLLPAQQKRELLLNFFQKRLLFLFICVFLAAVCFFAVLFSLKNVLLTKQKGLIDIIEQKENVFRKASVQDFKTVFEKASQQLEIGQNLWQEQIFLVPFFEKLGPLIPNSIYLTNLSAKKVTQEPAKTQDTVQTRKAGERFFNIVVSGFAPSREDLFLFKQNLKKESNFQNANFAISSWVKPTDVDFSLNLEFSFFTNNNQ